jgi:abequosyltransferase
MKNSSCMFLTIVIPTYRRPVELVRLLHRLVAEYEPVAGMIHVIISDNASPDGVPLEVSCIVEDHPWMALYRQSNNVGPDQNFLSAVDHVTTPYFWLLGDDDLMVPGLLKPLIDYLAKQIPDLLYLPSYWTTADIGVFAREYANPKLQFVGTDAETLAVCCHVNLTFISSWIVKSTHRRASKSSLGDPNRMVGTNLLQLSWMLHALSHGSNFGFAQGVCVVASSANTGGYKLLTVFGKNLKEILVDRLGNRRELLAPILNRLAWTYLPSLIWFSRRQQAGIFLSEDYESALASWSSSWAYKIVHKPMLKLPKRLAFVLFIVIKVLDRLWTLSNRYRHLSASTKV